MGGHGGLNILPQKSWNVYNFDNREKVKKDEEEAARKEALEKQQARQRDAEFRLEKLREAAQARNVGPGSSKKLRISNGEGEERPALEQAIEQNGRERPLGSSSTAERPQHFNLFEGIEIVEDHTLSSSRVQNGKERREDTREGSGSDKRDSKGKKGEAKKVVEPQDAGYEFGFGLVGKSGKRPWYSTKGFMVDRTGNTVAGTPESGSRIPGSSSILDGCQLWCSVWTYWFNFLVVPLPFLPSMLFELMLEFF